MDLMHVFKLYTDFNQLHVPYLPSHSSLVVEQKMPEKVFKARS